MTVFFLFRAMRRRGRGRIYHVPLTTSTDCIVAGVCSLIVIGIFLIVHTASTHDLQRVQQQEAANQTAAATNTQTSDSTPLTTVPASDPANTTTTISASNPAGTTQFFAGTADENPPTSANPAIVPGTWRTAGGTGCTWSVKTWNTDTENWDVSANSWTGAGSQTVEIEDGQFFEISGPCTWTNQ